MLKRAMVVSGLWVVLSGSGYAQGQAPVPPPAAAGQIRGDVQGQVQGQVQGLVQGQLQGQLQGDVQGQVQGPLQGQVQGPLQLIVDGEVPEDACEEPWITATEAAALDNAERTSRIERLMQCVKWSIANTAARVEALSAVNLGTLVSSLTSERDRLNELLDARTADLNAARTDVTDGVTERDGLMKEIEELTAFVDSAKVNIPALTTDLEETTAELNATTDELNAAEKASADLGAEKTQLTGQIETLTAERDDLKMQITQLGRQMGQIGVEAEQKRREIIQKFQDALAAVKEELANAKAEIETLVAARDALSKEVNDLNKQLADAKVTMAQLRIKRDQLMKQIEWLNKKLAKAEEKIEKLKGKVDRLAEQRSAFFAALRKALGDNAGVIVVGDRFIFPSEVLFAVGSDELSEAGAEQIRMIAKVVVDLQESGQIPDTIHWVLQVNGHTDVQRILPGSRFLDNWELSAARALTVVRLLVQEGVSAEHLAAAGFGQYQPLVEGDSQESYARNRRIELKLTDDGVQRVPLPNRPVALVQ